MAAHAGAGARHAGKRLDDPRRIWKLLLILWTLFIWAHSLIPGVVSSEESMLFVRIIQPLFRLVGVTDIDIIHTLVRKGAHMSEYLVLGVLTIVAIRPRLEVPLWPAVETVLIWMTIPGVDEFIQTFVPGRVGALGDVGIDMFGFAIGAVITFLVNRWQEAEENAREEEALREREIRAERYRRKARRAAREREKQRKAAGVQTTGAIRTQRAARRPKHAPIGTTEQFAPQPQPEARESVGNTSDIQVRPRHSLGSSSVSRGRQRKIEVVPESSRKRFKDRTRRY